MFCDCCIKVQRSTIFTHGCTVMKKEGIPKHANSKDHAMAISLSKQKAQMNTACVASFSKSEKAVTTAMANVYFAAKQNLPSSIVPELNELMIYQGISQLNDLRLDGHTTYGHSTSIGGFQAAIGSVFETELKSKLSVNKKFSLMFNESTDVSVHQNLIVYLRLLETTSLGYIEPQTYFLGIDSLVKADAPVSTVECERGFSRQNLVKTYLRISMSLPSLENLMKISIDGPSLETFDFTAAFKVWASIQSENFTLSLANFDIKQIKKI